MRTVLLVALQCAVAIAAQCTVENGTCFSTGHYMELDNVTLAACCDACANATGKCNSWTFHNDENHCLLKKDAPGSREQKSKCVSGAPGPAAPTPPPTPGPAPPPPPAGAKSVLYFVGEQPRP